MKKYHLSIVYAMSGYRFFCVFLSIIKNKKTIKKYHLPIVYAMCGYRFFCFKRCSVEADLTRVGDPQPSEPETSLLK